MSDEYIPRYKSGILSVYFKKDCPEGIPKYLEEKFSYKMLENSNFDWHNYDVGEDIDRAIENFGDYSEFVDWVEKTDERLENRFTFREDLEDMVKNLDGHFEKNTFSKELSEIIKYIKNFKD